MPQWPTNHPAPVPAPPESQAHIREKPNRRRGSVHFQYASSRLVLRLVSGSEQRLLNSFVEKLGNVWRPVLNPFCLVLLLHSGKIGAGSRGLPKARNMEGLGSFEKRTSPDFSEGVW